MLTFRKGSFAIPAGRVAAACLVPLAFALALAGCGTTATETEETVVEGEIGKRLDEYLTRITPFGFSGVLLVSDDGEILLNKGYGMADRAAGVANTAGTVMSTGSITKQFTAAGIMKLEMEGLLHTGDTIDACVEGVPADKAGITLHHLLTHTAGVTGGTGPDYEEAGRDETVRKILDEPLYFEPGAGFSYSNAGYSLLAAIIEKVSGVSYEEFLRSRLFEPAGMEFTGYRLPDWDRRAVAHWYVGEADNGTPLEKAYPQWNLLGNGGILSTTTDMHSWYLALKGADVFSGPAKQKLWTPNAHDYAYGWDVVQGGDRGMVIQHDGGSTLGNSAEFRWFVAQDVLVMLFCNQAYGGKPLMSAVRDKIEALAFGGEVDLPPETVPTDHALLEELAGKYRLHSRGDIVVSVDGDVLRMATFDQEAVNAMLFPDVTAPGRFQDLNLRSNALVAAAVRGDPEPFEREFLSEGVAERVFATLSQEIAAFEERTGGAAMMSMSLGTIPGFEEGFLMSGLRIRTDTGDEKVLSFVWKEGRIVGLDELAYEVAVPLAQTSDGTFVGYHLVFGKPIPTAFERDDDGKVVALLIGDAGTRAVRLHTHEHHDEHGSEEP